MPQLTRRQFAQAATVAVAAGAPAAPVSAAEERPALVVTADLLLEVAKLRYARALTAAQLEPLRDSIFRGLAMGQRLRAMKLRNADEPAVVFSPDVP